MNYISSDESEGERGGLPLPFRSSKRDTKLTKAEKRLKHVFPYIQYEKTKDFTLRGGTVTVVAGYTGIYL
jgi:hypothetical protein